MLKLIPYILVICSFSTQLIHAQTYFNKDYESDSAAWFIGSSIYPLKDTSGYIAIGSKPKGGGVGYASFLHIDIYGDTLLDKTIGDYNYGLIPSLGNLISIHDTNFVFTAILLSDSLQQNQDSTFIKLFKVDKKGKIIWERVYGDSGKINAAKDVKATVDGGYIITGWTTGWGNTGANSSFLLKVDSLGNEEWHKIYGGGQRYSYSVEVNSNNEYLIAGTKSVPPNKLDINWIKTDSLGNLIWDKTIGTPNNDHSFSYIKDYNNTSDYIVTSALVESESPVDLQAYIARVNSSGNIIWSDTLGTIGANANEVFANEVEVLPNGDIVAIGGITDVSNFGVDGWIVKYNGNGEMLWQRYFDKYGGPNDNYFWDIHQTYDGGFIICGDLTDVANSVQKLWVLKLDSMGCEVANCSVGLEDEIKINQEVLVYPNPTHEVLNISTTFNYQFIYVYNLSGKLVKTITANTQIKVSDLPKGMYFIKLAGNGNNMVKKFIKE